jgi:predicted metal-dependent peptidase
MAKMDKMSKARAKLLIQHPFFASLIMSMPYEMTTDVPTAATDGKKHYYNPEFMESLTIDEIMGVQAHEASHDMLYHVLRMFGRSQRVWNMACDYAVNHIILSCGMKLPEGCLVDPELGKNSADVNYEILMKKMEDNRKKNKTQASKNGEGNGGPERGEGEPDDGLTEDALGQDMRAAPDNTDPAKQAQSEQEIRQRVAQAANIARMAGKMPGVLERFVNEILNPQVPWQEYLREYMTRMVKSDESWAKRNRRFADTYLPTRHSEQMGELVVIADTSGSIGDKELNQIAAEIKSIADEIKPERIRTVWADTRVANEEVFECGDDLVFHPAGGGGTDMRVPLEHVRQYEPEVVVMITDGYTPWPNEEPDYPLIVVCTTDTKVPIGQVVRTH